jgi:hypothetical protein
MGSSTTKDVLTAVRTALASVTGTGAYTFNLSAEHSRVFGRPTRGSEPTPPCAWIALGAMSSSHGPQVGRYRRNVEIDILAFAPTASDSTGDRQNAGADLLDDICQAIESDRTLGGLLLDLIIESATFDGAQAGMNGTAGVRAVISGYFHANSAAGV